MTADTAKQEGWKPRETAPLDGTMIDLWTSNDGGARLPDCRWHIDLDGVGRWEQSYAENPGSFFCIWEGEEITHWMSRPEPPGLAADDIEPLRAELADLLEQAADAAEGRDRAAAW